MRKPKPTRAAAPSPARGVHDDQPVQQVRKTRHPVVPTQHAARAAVLPGTVEHEERAYTVGLLQSIRRGEAGIDAGLGVSHAEAMSELLNRCGAA